LGVFPLWRKGIGVIRDALEIHESNERLRC